MLQLLMLRFFPLMLVFVTVPNPVAAIPDST